MIPLTYLLACACVCELTLHLSLPLCFPWQCRRGSDRLFYHNRGHAGADEAREVGGYLRSRDLHARSEELHGADRRSVYLHPRGPAGGRHLREHGGPGAEPVHTHPETHAGVARGHRHRHGTGV